MFLSYSRILGKIIFRVFLFILIGAFLLEILGCKGTTINPTSPTIETPTPDPTPTESEMPNNQGPTPTPKDEGCDNYGETPNDPNLIVLLPDGDPVTVKMECTGDIDWYKIEIPRPPVMLEIELTNISDDSDFDMIAYDADLFELKDGRSAQTGNVDEQLLLEITESLIYLQIHSYNGWGTATLRISIVDDSPDDNDDGADDDGADDDEEEEEFHQLAYDEVLAQDFPLYPRGTMTSLLERSVETIVTKSVVCQLNDSELTGTFTIGNYAHVERDFLQLIDYIDGWALVVFNGSKELLDNLELTIRVTLFAPEIDLEVEIPYSMEMDGHEYIVSTSQKNVYYASEMYGDFSGNSRDDIRITSGVVGDLGDLFANNIFTQQVEVRWEYGNEIEGYCSGSVSGRAIVDFSALKRLGL